MTIEQQTVVKGAVSGLLGMAVLTWLFYTLLPTPVDIDESLERIVYALRWNAVAALPLFVMLATIGNRRFLGGVIDPLKASTDRSFQIDTRVATNTLEQTFVFFISSTALATFLSIPHIKLIGAFALVFIIARFVFWFGYRRHSLYRAPGMAATYITNLSMLIAVSIFLVSAI